VRRGEKGGKMQGEKGRFAVGIVGLKPAKRDRTGKGGPYATVFSFRSKEGAIDN